MSDWQMVYIPEVLFFQEGPGVRNSQYTNSGVKLLNVANLQNGKVDLETSQRYISEEEACGKYKHFLVDDGDLIIASSGIKVEYFDKKMGFVNGSQLPLCMNTSTIRFKPLNKSILDMKFFMYYLKTNQFKAQLDRLITGSAQLNFGPSHLKQITFPLPPLDTQQKIAHILDKSSDLIELRKAQIEKLDLLVKSQFIEMFGDPETNPKDWKETTIGDSCYSVKDGPHVSPSYVDEGEGIPFISTRNLVNGDGIDWSSAKYISETDYETYIKKSKPEKGDILYSKGGTTGVARYVDTDRRFANWVHIAVLKFSNNLDGLFFQYMLNSDYCYRQSQSLTKGIANRDLVLSAMKQIKFYLPPIGLQYQFINLVKQVDKSKFEIQKSLEKLETLKKSLMQKYFG